MNRRAKIVLVLLVLPVAVPLMFISLISLNKAVNEVRVRKFGEQLTNLPIPAKTDVVNQSERITNYGNGNYCGFEARVTFQSELTEDELETFYKGQNLTFRSAPFAGRGLNIPFRVVPQSKDGDVTQNIFDFLIFSSDEAWFDTRCW